MTAREITRRDLLKGAAGLHLALVLSPSGSARVVLRAGPDGRPRDPGPLADGVAMGIYLALGTDGTPTVTIPRPDMGQGPRTSLAMAVAEELEVDWSTVRIEQAPADDRYGSQTSGGSTSTRNFHVPMMRAGAAARIMLVRAAASRWGVDPSTCRAEMGRVVHDGTGRSAGYGELATAAAALPVPPDDQITLKRPADYRIVGHDARRLDGPALATGEARFGLDVRLPNMLVATIARPPAFGGRVATFDEAAARAVPGVRDVRRHGRGVAVLADDTWAALAGREALGATWDPGPNASLDDAGMRRRLADRVGDLPELPGDAARRVEAVYELPYLAHAPMEPMNATASVVGDRCEVWAPTQAPQAVRDQAASGAGVPRGNVTAHVTFTGGGFGRRLAADYASEAAALSKAVGRPVQVVWTREDDMRNAAHYRPASHHAMRGALDAAGRPTAWIHRMVIARGGGDLDAAASEDEPGERSLLQSSPYSIPGARVDTVAVSLPVPTGAWRSVDATQVGFANESFVDEMAHAAGADPYSFRRDLLRDGRLRGVLDLAAERSGWSTPPPVGVGRGIACYTGFGSYAAHVAEVSVAEDGVVRVLRVVAAIDCGIVVNPLAARAQVEGAISDGVSTCLSAGLTLVAGGIAETSYADYRWLRIDGMPRVEVHFVPSTASVGGLGEPGFPSVSPAITNAIFALTGRRIRALPVRTSELAGWSAGTPRPPTDTPAPGTPSPTAGTPPPSPGTPSVTPTGPTPTPPDGTPTGGPGRRTIHLPSVRRRGAG